jgi:hypothetical protein
VESSEERGKRKVELDMENYLQDLEAWCWQYKECRRDYAGLHFTAKPMACDALLTCVERLRQEGYGAWRTIPLKQLRPEEERKIYGGREYEIFAKLRIAFHEESDLLRQMSVRAEQDIALFDITEVYLSEFERKVADVKKGIGDICIGPFINRRNRDHVGELDLRSENLWFWPCFGHLSVVD